MYHALKHRIHHHRNLNRGGSWWSQHNKDLESASVAQLTNLQEIIKEHRPGIKVRIEEPTIQIYSNSEDTLRLIATQIEDKSAIQAIQFPKNEVQLALLKEGKILTKPGSRINYNYKVMLRDGGYSVETKRQILNYLNNLEDEVKVSKGSLDMLTLDFKYLWGCFLYVNDPSVLTFLNIISPNIILSIHELAVSE